MPLSPGLDTVKLATGRAFSSKEDEQEALDELKATVSGGRLELLRRDGGICAQLKDPGLRKVRTP
jgi:hypothetical protein